MIESYVIGIICIALSLWWFSRKRDPADPDYRVHRNLVLVSRFVLAFALVAFAITLALQWLVRPA